MSDRDYWREGGSPGFWTSYPATKGILIVLAGIHLAMAMVASADPAVYSAIFRFLALSPTDVIGRFRVWQVATYALLHAPGIGHLLWNCLGIFIFGRLVEQRIGTTRYLLFALGTVVAGGLGFLLLSAIQGTRMPMIGASGLDFGVLILAALWYPQMTVLVMFVLPVPLWALATVLGFIGVYSLFQQADGIAHAAHVAGGFYALVYWRYADRIGGIAAAFDRWREQQRWRRMQAERRAAEELRGRVDRILDKVNREGMAALTDEERRALKEASERLRR
ncbi:MAG: rhomboid family intramembrane serine protease [Planctomycetes bacterium]|nr:rhomboid family intramembrane serine protease [Planctomycetota bacterium]